jgi:hypothetical protein
LPRAGILSSRGIPPGCSAVLLFVKMEKGHNA